MKNKLLKIGASLLFGLAAGLIVYFGLFEYFELFFEDAVYQRENKLNNKIKIIAIDDKSQHELGDYGEWSRQVYADLINTLNTENKKPAVIAFDIMLFDEKDAQGDMSFVKACKDGGNVVTASKLDTGVKYFESKKSTSTLYVTDCIEPFDKVYENVDTGYVNIILDNDGYLRHALPFVTSGNNTYKSFSTVIYEKYTKKQSPFNNPFLIDYSGKPGSYEVISLSDVLDGKVSAKTFDECIVIVGSYSEGMLDSYSVPIDRRTLMYGVEVNANILQAMLDERHMDFPDKALSSVITGVLVAAFLFLICGRNVRTMTAGLLIASAGYITACCIFYESGILLIIFYPIIAFISVYILCLIFKYASERRKRTKELHELLFSMAEAMTEAIDGRTPYNASHTRKVADYAVSLARYINEMHKKKRTALHLSQKEIEEIHLAALLHDVGKLDIPLEVLDKPTRLGNRLDKFLDRYKQLSLSVRVDVLSKKATDENKLLEQIATMRDFVISVNAKEWLSDKELNYANTLKDMSYTSSDGTVIAFLTDDEYDCITINKGTLTKEEMETVHEHATYTDKILGRIKFGGSYTNVRRIASSHHELLNGKGYPNKLSGDEIDTSVRILTIADVFDALTADDRPYKKAKTREEAFKILGFMKKDGEIDGEILSLAEEIWMK